MISYIIGKITYTSENSIIIENNGIGYNINISSSTLNKINSKDEKIKIYTYMNVKEDELSLYGFLTMEEINLFNILITVSGVGPKGALSLLTVMSPSEIILSIVTNDIKTLSKGQGIGKKTAQRIVLELCDKVKTNDSAQAEYSSIINENTSITEINKQDSIDALIELGFTRSEAVRAVLQVYEENLDTSQIISRALKKLSI